MAVSHYQVEGDDRCDWTAFEEAGRVPERCGRAVDSWRRYEEDAALAAGLGANAFRFSVSWSRIEPQEGRFDAAALARYRRLVDELVRLGLEPIVTLHHFTHPQWFVDRGGWLAEDAARLFARFSARVVHELSPPVRVWVTLNEPLVFLLGGFVDGRMPPGLSDVAAAGAALRSLLEAHVRAADAIRDRVPAAAVGFAHNFLSFAAERWWSPFDVVAAHLAERAYDAALPRAFATGRWNLWFPGLGRMSGSLAGLAGSIDFLGVNFYSRMHVRSPGGGGKAADFRYLDRSRLGLSDVGWEIVPDELERMLRIAAAPGFPLLVTENGIADASDARRSAYLERHLAALLRAEGSGVPIHGYLHWSLLDNFEWLEGMRGRFGLYEVDPETLARTARPSAATFRSLARIYLGGNLLVR